MAKTKIQYPKIKLLHDRVLVLPATAEEKTASGIIIPDSAKEKKEEGIVVAIGPGKPDYDMVLKLGDRVLYGKYSGAPMEYEGVEYQMMKEFDVFAVYTGGEVKELKNK